MFVPVEVFLIVSRSSRTILLLSHANFFPYKIASHLHPRDLLRLSRTSKRIRATLYSKASRSVWQGALASVDGLPRCPDDMDEPAYAALLYGDSCFVCAISITYALELNALDSGVRRVSSKPS